jgi:pimeloyl-ACP methyl ester carboxylesterase
MRRHTAASVMNPDGSSMPAKRAYTERTVEVRTADGIACNVINVRGPVAPTRPPVLFVHGAGVRANIFRAPVETSFVDYLIERGHDVWLENWRASIDLPPNQWTLDDAAVHEHPASVQAVIRETGADNINAVIHCQGSTSFMMSVIAGLVPQVRTIVANAVSLHPVMPPFSLVKMKYALPVVSRMFPYLSPGWGEHAPGLLAKVVTGLVRVTHQECDNNVCRMVSFVYGAGFPALWRHENLNDATHEWLKHEFAEVPMSFFWQLAKCVARGNLVSVKGYKELPEDFAARAPQTDARFALFAGARNLCFLPESQRQTFDFFEKHQPGRHSVQIFDDYSHLDVFMGHRAAIDTFPAMANALEQH